MGSAGGEFGSAGNLRDFALLTRGESADGEWASDAMGGAVDFGFSSLGRLHAADFLSRETDDGESFGPAIDLWKCCGVAVASRGRISVDSGDVVRIDGGLALPKAVEGAIDALLWRTVVFGGLSADLEPFPVERRSGGALDLSGEYGGVFLDGGNDFRPA